MSEYGHQKNGIGSSMNTTLKYVDYRIDLRKDTHKNPSRKTED